MSLTVALFLDDLDVLARRDDAVPAVSVIVVAATMSQGQLRTTLEGLSSTRSIALEILLVDHGATGPVRTALVDFWRKDDRAVLLRFRYNRGLPAIGVNAALARALGRHVVYQTGKTCYRDDALARMADCADRSGAICITSQGVWPPHAAALDGAALGALPLDDIMHSTQALLSVGLADPHLLMRHDWDDDLRERLTREAAVAVPHSFTRSLEIARTARRDRLVAERRAVGRAAWLQPDRMERIDVLDASFLSSPQLIAEFGGDIAAPYIARHWQMGERLHPAALQHTVPYAPVRLCIEAETQLPSFQIAFGNFQEVFPDLFSYRAVNAPDERWPLPGDDGFVRFRSTAPIEPAIHQAYRDLAKPVIYAFDDDLLNLHEYKRYGETYFNTERNHVIDHVRDADCVITWSRTLADVVRPYNPAVCNLDTNVPIRRLATAPSQAPIDGRLIYTTLTNDLEHRADMWEGIVVEWADFFQRHRDSVRLVLFGTREQDEQYYRRWFAGIDYEIRPPLPYDSFLTSAARSGFHFVMTHLRDARTPVRSKCPVKLLDATVCGAVLLVSDIEIYRLIDDGVNGLKAGDGPGAWTEVLERSLALGAAGRVRIWNAANRLVERDFVTQRQFFPFFLTMETARLTAALRAGGRTAEVPVVLLVESAATEDAARLHQWAALLERVQVKAIVVLDDARDQTDAIDRLTGLMADRRIGIVQTIGVHSPWLAAARHLGLPGIAIADLADATSEPQPAPAQQPELVVTPSGTVARRLRAAGWTHVQRLGAALPDASWDGALPPWPADPARGIAVDIRCVPDADAGRVRAALDGACVTLGGEGMRLARVDTGAACDLLIVSGAGGAVIASALRAMASGCIVIAVQAPDVEEILQSGVNGWSIGRDNRIALTVLLRSIMGLSAQEMAQVRQNARATAWARASESAFLLTVLGQYRQTLERHSMVVASALPPRRVDTFDGDTDKLSDWTIAAETSGGYVDAVRTESGADSLTWRDDDILLLDGWAGDTKSGIAAKAILFSIGDTVVGAADVRWNRPDVAGAIHTGLLQSGWHAELLIGHLAAHVGGSQDAVLKLWAVLPDGDVLLPVLENAPIHIPARDLEVSLEGFQARNAVRSRPGSVLVSARGQDLLHGLSFAELSEDHADAVVRWRNDPGTRTRFLTGQTLTPETQIRWTQHRRTVAGDHTFVALWQGTPVGMVAIYGVEPIARDGEFGRIVIDPAWRRRGLGRILTAWIVEYGFGALALNRIYANCLSDNRPIHRLLMSFGFQSVSTWRHADTDQDVTRLELGQDAWPHTGTDAVRAALARDDGND